MAASQYKINISDFYLCNYKRRVLPMYTFSGNFSRPAAWSPFVSKYTKNTHSSKLIRFVFIQICC